MLKTVRAGNSEILLRSHDGGRGWFASPAEVLQYRRRRERLRLDLRRKVHASPIFSQNWYIYERPAPLPPPQLESIEREIWFAVLLRAVDDLRGVDVRVGIREAERCRRNAAAWFESSLRTAGSFRWICDVLDLPAATVRRRIFALADRENSGSQGAFN